MNDEAYLRIEPRIAGLAASIGARGLGEETINSGAWGVWSLDGHGDDAPFESPRFAEPHLVPARQRVSDRFDALEPRVVLRDRNVFMRARESINAALERSAGWRDVDVFGGQSVEGPRVFGIVFHNRVS